MNERIRELAEQAGYFIAFDPDSTLVHTSTPGADGDLTLFAKLIIEDCVKINLEILSFTAYARLYQRYQEHFEVDAKLIKAGSRVKVISGFNVGAKGTVSYIEPTGKMWVLRDGANSDVFYHPEEVIGIEE